MTDINQKSGYTIFIALVTWFALGLQQYILIDNTPDNGFSPLGAVGHFLLFYTVLTNLLIAISLTAILINPQSSLGLFFSKSATATAIAVYIVVVAIVYNFILRNLVQLSGSAELANELLHVVVPVLYVLYWIFFVLKGSIKWSSLFYWLIYPALYLIYALTRGIMSGTYAYPFLNLTKLGSTRVFANCLILFIAFIVVSALFIWLDKIIRKPRPSTF